MLSIHREECQGKVVLTYHDTHNSWRIIADETLNAGIFQVGTRTVYSKAQYKLNFACVSGPDATHREMIKLCRLKYAETV